MRQVKGNVPTVSVEDTDNKCTNNYSTNILKMYFGQFSVSFCNVLGPE